MQGRLSPIENNKIQSFPRKNWQNEFVKANGIGFSLLEWTLDQDNLYSNPIMNQQGRQKIMSLSKQYNISVPSLTGDCFMQAPFLNTDNIKETNKLKLDFINIIDSCNLMGIEIIVVPLVDEGKIENKKQEEKLVDFLTGDEINLENLKIKILFESDLPPNKLKKFISQFDLDYFGINYDTGNSASYGFNPIEEFNAYGENIFNIHIKDRPYGGSTVPLGMGDADFKLIFELLDKYNYSSNLILQTARAENDEHDKALIQYREFILNIIKKNEFKS